VINGSSKSKKRLLYEAVQEAFLLAFEYRISNKNSEIMNGKAIHLTSIFKNPCSKSGINPKDSHYACIILANLF